MTHSDKKCDAQEKLFTIIDSGNFCRGAKFLHYKGGMYQIVCLSVDEETMEHLITYRSVSKFYKWTRKLSRFTERVNKETGELDPNGVLRFSPMSIVNNKNR